jgi:hypothetical protein
MHRLTLFENASLDSRESFTIMGTILNALSLLSSAFIVAMKLHRPMPQRQEIPSAIPRSLWVCCNPLHSVLTQIIPILSFDCCQVVINAATLFDTIEPFGNSVSHPG